MLSVKKIFFFGYFLNRNKLYIPKHYIFVIEIQEKNRHAIQKRN